MTEPWTPGPWTDLGPSDFRGKLIVGASRPAPDGMDTEDGLIHTAVAEALEGVETPLEANARLIAAAPRLANLIEADDVGTVQWLTLRDELMAEIRGEDVSA